MQYHGFLISPTLCTSIYAHRFTEFKQTILRTIMHSNLQKAVCHSLNQTRIHFFSCKNNRKKYNSNRFQAYVHSFFLKHFLCFLFVPLIFISYEYSSFNLKRPFTTVLSCFNCIQLGGPNEHVMKRIMGILRGPFGVANFRVNFSGLTE